MADPIIIPSPKRTYHHAVAQSTDEWFSLRCGMLTASDMHKIIAPKTLAFAESETMRAHLYELLAQRITRYVEPTYISDDMMRGTMDEERARVLYAERFAPVKQCGFVTYEDDGMTIGYSPDGLVGSDGLIECKSRKQAYQILTILSQGVPTKSTLNCMMQIQTGLLVTGRGWCDFISYCAGLPMLVSRVYPDPEAHRAIVAAARTFNALLDELQDQCETVVNTTGGSARFVPTERFPHELTA